jgi:hypothetical protein
VKFLGLIVLLAAIFQALTSGVLAEAFTVNFSLAQICVLPLAAILLWKVRVGKRYVPRVVVAVAMVGAVVGLSYGYTHAVFSSKPVLLARFQDDPIEAKTRRFRKVLNRELLSESRMRVGRYHRSLNSHHELRSASGRGAEVYSVLWGNSGWIQLSLSEDFLEAHHPAEAPIWGDFLSEYGLVNHAPALGLTVNPEPATLRFLSAMLQALQVSPTTSVPLSLKKRALRASFLRSAAGMQSTWSSYAHRAYPLFLLANQHLREAFRQGGQDWGELQCAIEVYAVAEKYLANGDNPDLQAAVFNNKAVALLAMGLLRPKGNADKRAREYLRLAMRMSGIPSPFGAVNIAPNVAPENWRTLLEANPGRRRERRKFEAGKKGKKKRKGSGKKKKKKQEGKRLAEEGEWDEWDGSATENLKKKQLQKKKKKKKKRRREKGETGRS